MRLRLATLIAISGLASACTQFPELDRAIGADVANAPPPALVPLAPLIAQANAADRGAAEVQTALSPRLSSLRNRAARLRGPVIPQPVRNRMLRGIR